MPTVLVRSAEPTKMAFERALPVRPSSLLKKKAAATQRCLFGVPDHQDSIRVARNEIRIEQRRLTSKYNFDFENDAPLPGKFVYKKMIDTTLSPIENRLQHDGFASSVAEKENAVYTTTTSSTGGIATATSTCVNLVNNVTLTSNNNNSNTQMSLTDFYTVSRKRACPFEATKLAKCLATTTTIGCSYRSKRLSLAEICE